MNSNEEEPISNCCGANFGFPGWPDCDICSACGDHAGPEEEEFDDAGEGAMEESAEAADSWGGASAPSAPPPPPPPPPRQEEKTQTEKKMKLNTLFTAEISRTRRHNSHQSLSIYVRTSFLI